MYWNSNQYHCEIAIFAATVLQLKIQLDILNIKLFYDYIYNTNFGVFFQNSLCISALLLHRYNQFSYIYTYIFVSQDQTFSVYFVNLYDEEQFFEWLFDGLGFAKWLGSFHQGLKPVFYVKCMLIKRDASTYVNVRLFVMD